MVCIAVVLAFCWTVTHATIIIVVAMTGGDPEALKQVAAVVSAIGIWGWFKK